MKSKINRLCTLILVLVVGVLQAQQQEPTDNLNAVKKANNLIYQGNSLAEDEDFIAAEMEYRKAISKYPNTAVGNYNLAHTFYKKGTFDEALYINQMAVKNAVTKEEKHKAYHNIGNVLMQNKLCKEAVEAYKNALRSNPTDDETRYNLALAKECAEEQEGDGEEDKEDDKGEDENKEDQDKKDDGDEKDDNKDEGDKDKKEGEDKEDENGDPKENKKDDGKGDENKKQKKPKPQPGQLSPQQIKNILEAMNNQEQKVQEKINAEKQKGAKIKTEKDW
ncbi:MAG: aerotolerance regulator BatC [Bacteroidia bacterium]|nr:aerotolerance regulator BatC [Winogradskyella sp.]MBT8376845.1 aerotolerance regulator BatC [Bacteroidia bacterium]NNF86091.1 aerotolerance regulator BatC [Winogradskyella sp.]NNL82726.1 aerotolerance regulator BatC [Winogradskyella sp.]